MINSGGSMPVPTLAAMSSSSDTSSSNAMALFVASRTSSP